LLAHGPQEIQQAIILPPLFDELNYTRGFIVDIMRALSALNIGTWLPDLPGTGESPHPLDSIGWDDWLDAARVAGEAVAAQSGARPHVIALRGGNLLAHAVNGRSCWSFAPASGASLLRQLQRAQLISDKRNIDHQSDMNVYMGYTLSADMQFALENMGEPTPLSPLHVREASSTEMLWRRAEPARAPELSTALAAEIAQWIATCEAR
jgi:hypothetical protein